MVDPLGLREGDWWDPRTYAGASAMDLWDHFAHNAALVRHDVVEAFKIAPEVGRNLVGWGDRRSTIAESFSSGHAVVSGSAEVQTVGNKLTLGIIPPAPTDYEDPQFNEPAKLGVKVGEADALAINVALTVSGPGVATNVSRSEALLTPGPALGVAVSTPVPGSAVVGVPSLVYGMAGANGSGSSSTTPSSANASQPKINSPSSKALGENLEASGVSRPPSHDAHHIVSGTDARAAMARAILKREGIGINDAVNGVFLPASQDVARAGTVTHGFTMTNSYQLEIVTRLQTAAPGTVRAVLADIARELQLGTFPK
jgi:hypothetical protein